MSPEHHRRQRAVTEGAAVCGRVCACVLASSSELALRKVNSTFCGFSPFDQGDASPSPWAQRWASSLLRVAPLTRGWETSGGPLTENDASCCTSDLETGLQRLLLLLLLHGFGGWGLSPSLRSCARSTKGVWAPRGPGCSVLAPELSAGTEMSRHGQNVTRYTQGETV